MPVPTILAYAITFTVYWKYLIIFFATTFGGPFLMLAAGFLIRQNVFDVIPIFLVLALGELTWDACWYVVGYRYADRFIARWGRVFSFSTDTFKKVKTLFARYHGITLFLNKLFMGLGMGIAVLVTGGATKIPFLRYMLWNALGEIVWVSLMLYIGYEYAALYAHVAFSLRIEFIIGTVLVVILLGYGLVTRARNHFLQK